MRVLQAGIDKSGNYWLWRMIRLLMEEADIPRKSWIVNDPIYEVAKTWDHSFPQAAEVDVISWDKVPSSAYRAATPELQPFRERSYYYCVIPMYRRRIDDIDAYLDANTHLWTHAPWHDDLPADLLGRIDKCIYILRDPRDILVSAAHFVDTEFCRKEFGVPRIPLAERYPRLLQNVAEWAVHVAGWIGHAREAGLHVVSYEGLNHDLRFQLERMSAYLELGLGKEQIERVAKAVSFGSMKSDGSAGHVRKGKVGNWRTELPADIAEQAAGVCRPLLDLFGYKNLEHELSPFLSHGELSDEIRTVLRQINDLQYSAQPNRPPQRPATAPPTQFSSGWR